ncbi:methyltransferase [Anaerobacterium chartisolvens]|uniref:Methyltransferase n=2 Tax=Anaerobacterium chartisolvens TaxID=1297424 RepID=A0A369B9G8_9FIRM|nr:methyltransferase [Anaerobacterium chartisolvens]
MKILLIWPPLPEYCVLTQEFSCCEPLGLEYIAAPVIDKFGVEILDMRFDKNLLEVLKQKEPDIVGLSIPYTTTVNVCNDLLKIIKAYNPNIKVIIGGHHPTVGLRHISTEYVDYVIVGEGVETLRNLLEAIAQNGDLREINGLAFKASGEFIYNKSYELQTLDYYPQPARNLTAKYRDKYFHAHYKPVALMRFSYGCPYNCSFCVLWKLCNRKYISRNNELVVKELLELDNENIYVVDDEAFINTDNMNDLADRIQKNNIKKKYHMYVRSDTVAKNPGLFEKWASIGLDSVLMGLESIFEDDLNEYNKSISSKTAYESLKILHSNGVEVRANFIIKPDYSKEKFHLVRKAVEQYDIDRPTFAVLTPFYGTDEYEKVKDKFIIEKLEFFDCYHTFMKTALPLKEFYYEFAELFKCAQNRKKDGNKEKVFYAGKSENSFEEMIDKMKGSYIFY